MTEYLDQLIKHVQKSDLKTFESHLKAYLILKGKTIDDLGTCDQTLLAVAITNEELEKAELLLRYGASLQLTLKGYTLFTHAVLTNNFDMVKLCLKYKPNFDTPVVLQAIIKDYIEVAELLLHYGIHHLDSFSLLDCAIECDQKKIVKFLIEQDVIVDINHLTYSITQDNFLIFNSLFKQYLKRKNTSINDKDSSGNTVLMTALKTQNVPAMTFLIQHNALDAPDENHNTALGFLVANQKRELITLLLENGAHTVNNRFSPDNRTALIIAASHDSETSTLQLLLDHKADINGMTTDGKTVLYYAMRSGSQRLFRFLIEQGANPSSLLTRRNLRIQDQIYDTLEQAGQPIKPTTPPTAFSVDIQSRVTRHNQKIIQRAEIAGATLGAQTKLINPISEIINDYLSIHLNGKRAFTTAFNNARNGVQQPSGHNQNDIIKKSYNKA